MGFYFKRKKSMGIINENIKKEIDASISKQQAKLSETLNNEIAI